MQKVARAVEPGVLAKHMLRPEDDRIRATDIPERLQAQAALGPSHFDAAECTRSAAGLP